METRGSDSRGRPNRGRILRDAQGNPTPRIRIVKEEVEVVNELQTKIAQAAFEAASELQGKFDLPNDGTLFIKCKKY